LEINGFPESGVTKIIYSAHSPNIVESKSLKLYLNSYNMYIPGFSSRARGFSEMVAQDVGRAVQDETINVSFIRPTEGLKNVYPFKRPFPYIEGFVEKDKLDIPQYTESPHLLQDMKLIEKEDGFASYSLRSNCRVTNQPDWGDVFVLIRGERTVTSSSFLQYIVSMRNENHFHEEVCEIIYKRLFEFLKPDELFVACLYTRRGGIDICPVRATSVELLKEVALNLLLSDILTTKTLRQ